MYFLIKLNTRLISSTLGYFSKLFFYQCIPQSGFSVTCRCTYPDATTCRFFVMRNTWCYWNAIFLQSSECLWELFWWFNILFRKILNFCIAPYEVVYSLSKLFKIDNIYGLALFTFDFNCYFCLGLSRGQKFPTILDMVKPLTHLTQIPKITPTLVSLSLIYFH